VRAGTLAAQAALDLDRGDAKTAIDIASQALALEHDGETETTDWDLAEIRLTLAKALRVAGTDPARASRLAGEARDAFHAMNDEGRATEAAALASPGAAVP
jgi:hypothetical protein